MGKQTRMFFVMVSEVAGCKESHYNWLGRVDTERARADFMAETTVLLQLVQCVTDRELTAVRFVAGVHVGITIKGDPDCPYSCVSTYPRVTNIGVSEVEPGPINICYSRTSLGHNNTVSQNRWSLVTVFCSLTLKCRTFCQKVMVLQNRE